MIGGPGWLSQQLLQLGLAVIVTSCLTLASLVVSTKGVRVHRRRDRARRLAPYRPALLELASGEEDDDSGSTLARVPSRDWPVVEESVVELLDKIKGETARRLVQVLREHRSLDHAREAVAARGAVRRGRAATVLGRSGDPEALDPLLTLLRDPDPLVRQSAAAGLGHLADPRAAEPLLSAVRAARGRARVPSGLVVDALLGMPMGVEGPLTRALGDPDPGVREVAARVVRDRTAVEARGTVRRHVLTESDPRVQVALCDALGRVGDPSDVPVLVDAASQGDRERRRAAARALGELDHAECVPALVALLGDDDRRVAATAAEALAEMETPEAATSLAALPDGRERDAAAYVLALQELRRPGGVGA